MPLTLLDIRGYHKFVIVEIGASAPGEILRWLKAARPEVAVITNVGNAHLESFKTRRSIIETKAEIIKAVSSDGFVVLNADDPSYMTMRDSSKVPVLSFSVEADDTDVFPINVIEQAALTHFEVFETPTRLPMGGIHNLYNALAALTVLKGLDLDYMRSTRRLKGFTPPPMRGNIFYVGPVVIINDAFNCNPSSLDASLT